MYIFTPVWLVESSFVVGSKVYSATKLCSAKLVHSERWLRSLKITFHLEDHHGSTMDNWSEKCDAE